MAKQTIDYSEVDIRTLPKAERPKPSTGQSGPEVEVPYEDLSSRKAYIVRRLNGTGTGTREVVPVKALVEVYIKEIDTEEDPVRAALLIRNDMRALVCSGWVERVAEYTDSTGSTYAVRGRYSITEKGRKRLKRASIASATTPPAQHGVPRLPTLRTPLPRG